MSVYVGIDVHRKRSQVAVIDAMGEVLVNRNVPNGVEPILSLIGGLPATSSSRSHLPKKAIISGTRSMCGPGREVAGDM